MWSYIFLTLIRDTVHFGFELEKSGFCKQHHETTGQRELINWSREVVIMCKYSVNFISFLPKSTTVHDCIDGSRRCTSSTVINVRATLRVAKLGSLNALRDRSCRPFWVACTESPKLLYTTTPHIPVTGNLDSKTFFAVYTVWVVYLVPFGDR